MAAVPAMGVMELLLVVLFGTGIGIPLGIPPGDFDPKLAAVAPDECLFYSSWAGMADPDPTTGNHTEQLLAEPEVKHFIGEVEATIKSTLIRVAAHQGDPRSTKAARLVPRLVKAVCVRPTAIFCERFQTQGSGVDVVAAMVVNLGDQAADVARDVITLVDLIPEAEVQSVEIAGHQFSQIMLDPAAPQVTWGVWQRYLVVGVGVGSLEGVMDRMSDASRSAPEWLTKSSEALSVPRPGTFSYLNLAALIQTASELGGPDASIVIDTLGLANVQSLSSASGLDDQAFVSRSQLVTDGPPRGVVELLRADALTADDLDGIPRDASWAMALRLDLERWYESVLEGAREVEPGLTQQAEEQLGQIEQALGLRLREDFLALLGDCWTLHTSTRSGGIVTGWTATVSLRDGDRFENVHNRLLGFASGFLSRDSRAPRIKTTTFMDHTIYSLDVPERGFFLSPSWCIADERLIVSLMPQPIRAYLNTPEDLGSLAKQPDMAALLAGDSPPFAMVYQDTRAHFELLYPLVQLAVTAFSKEVQREGIEIDPGILPSVGAVASHLRPTIRVLSTTEHGIQSMNRQTMPGSSMTASAPVIAAFILPALQVGRGVSRQAESKNQMKYFGLALHNYHDVFGRLPAAYSVDEAGKPLLSWRVHILPFLEETELYEQFHLDEPWDSQHNQSLIAQMPELYRSGSGPAGPGMTVYLGNASESGVFTPPTGEEAKVRNPTGIGFRDITDGLSNTVAVVEVAPDSAVEWTRPVDFQLDKDNPLKGLSGARPNGFLAVICDGSVRLIQDSIGLDTVRAMFTRNGGEVIRTSQVEMPRRIRNIDN